MSRSTTGSDDEAQEYPKATWRRELDLPDDRPIEPLDVRGLPAPEPMTETLERLADIDEAVLVQLNEREPLFLYPKLDERGFERRTKTVDDVVLTAIWQ